MIFSLDVRPARKGDCLLVHWGCKDDPGLMLIDGGPARVYRKHLRSRLDEIRAARQLGSAQALPVDVLMVSHVDDDHIHGILDLTGELVAQSDERRPALLDLLGCWHNTFDDIIGNTPEEMRASITAQFGAAAVGGDPENIEGLDADAIKVLASLGQGHRLRDDLRRLDVAINGEFGGKLIMARTEAKPVDLGRDLSLTVVGPMQAEIEALQTKHDEWLKKRDLKRSSPEAALAAFTDESVPNLSSIVALAELAGKRMLLTGDARGDKILEGLELTGLVPQGGSLHVDILKVPHHGSANNMEPSFFERVTADHYVFSGNGEHGNPERETLEMLFSVCGNRPFTLHFTYPIEEIDAERSKRRHWVPERDSLAALFAERDMPAAGQQVVCAQPNQPHVIDLLTPLGF